MKTIVITAQKGGSGKTTLARNLAVAAVKDGLRVLCLDLDPQSSLREWWRGRKGDAPAMLDRDPQPDRLLTTLDAVRAHFDLAFIDTPPAAPAWLSDVLKAADLALVPVRPSPDDLRAVGATIAALRSAGTEFAFVLSQTPRAKLTESAARALAQHGRVAPINIVGRIAYAETAATGEGVTETGDGKAAAEIVELFDYVKGLIG